MKKILLAVLLVLLPSLAWGAAQVYYVTGAGAGDKSGGTWATAMGEAEFETDLEGNAEAGDIYYVLGGETLTLDSAYDSSLKDGTAVAPISIIGVKAATTAEPPTYSDWPAVGSADRPTFDCVADYNIIFGDYYKVFNAIFDGTHGSTRVTSGVSGIFYNCKVDNGTATASQYALSVGSYSAVIGCELICDAGYCHGMGNSCSLLYSYLHDSVDGVIATGGSIVAFCVLDTMTSRGVIINTGLGIKVLNNTFYNCALASVKGTTGHSTIAINNIVDTTAADGFLWDTPTDLSFFWKNHEGNSVTDMWDGVDVAMPHMDPAVTSGDPKFVGAAAGNFTLGTTSPNLDAALGLELGDE